MIPEGVSMSKFAIGDRVKNVADDHESGTVAVFLTVDGRFRYVVDADGYGAIQFFSGDRLAFTHTRRGAA
jgi:hypothetical protein